MSKVFIINSLKNASKGGRVAGAVNYKKNSGIDVVSSVLLTGMEAWRIIASRY